MVALGGGLILMCEVPLYTRTRARASTADAVPFRPYPEYDRANFYPWSPCPPRRARPGPGPHTTGWRPVASWRQNWRRMRQMDRREPCALPPRLRVRRERVRVQGYLTYKKTPPPRTLPRGRQCKLAGRQCKSAGRKCKLAGRKCKLAGRKCKLAGRKCKSAGRKCKLAGRKCILAGKVRVTFWSDVMRHTQDSPAQILVRANIAHIRLSRPDSGPSEYGTHKTVKARFWSEQKWHT